MVALTEMHVLTADTVMFCTVTPRQVGKLDLAFGMFELNTKQIFFQLTVSSTAKHLPVHTVTSQELSVQYKKAWRLALS